MNFYIELLLSFFFQKTIKGRGQTQVPESRSNLAKVHISSFGLISSMNKDMGKTDRYVNLNVSMKKRNTDELIPMFRFFKQMNNWENFEISLSEKKRTNENSKWQKDPIFRVLIFYISRIC